MDEGLQVLTTVFTTERLRAVHWRDDHADVAHAAYSQLDFVRYLGNPTPHPDLAHTRWWIARINALQDGRSDGFWAVELRETGELVGAALCKPMPGTEGRPGEEYEIGWHVFPAHQRRGYATEIGRACAAYGFGMLGLDEVIAVVMPDNTPSLAVARAIGMTPAGRTDRYFGVEVELFTLRRAAATGPAAPRP